MDGFNKLYEKIMSEGISIKNIKDLSNLNKGINPINKDTAVMPDFNKHYDLLKRNLLKWGYSIDTNKNDVTFKKSNEDSISVSFSPNSGKATIVMYEKIMKPNNKQYGFFGTIKDQKGEAKAQKMYNDVFTSLNKKFPNIDDIDIRNFLDSKYGRHLADSLLDNKNIEIALKKTFRSNASLNTIIKKIVADRDLF